MNKLFRIILGVMIGVSAVLMSTSSTSAYLNTSDETAWMTNGTVYATLPDSQHGKYFVGGNFTQVFQYSGSGLEINTGEFGKVREDYDKPDGAIHVAISDRQGGWYIGGDFTYVGSVARNRLAHIFPNGTVDTDWNPNANGSVYALALASDNGSIYVGGAFTTIAGVTRNRIAEISTSDGTATSWDPNANGNVLALVSNAADTLVYAAGEFTTLNGGTTRNRLADIQVSDGIVTSWNPNIAGTVRTIELNSAESVIYLGGDFTKCLNTTRNRACAMNTAASTLASWNPSSNGVVRTLKLKPGESTIYAGGDFTTIGGQTRNYIGELNTGANTATTWNPNAGTSVYALDIDGSATTVYAGGAFLTIGGTARVRIAGINVSDGLLTSATSFANSTVRTVKMGGGDTSLYIGGDFVGIGGSARTNLAAFDLTSNSLDDGLAPSVNGIIYALASSSDSTILAGGAFTSFGGSTRNRLASFDPTTGAVGTWNPNADNTVYTITHGGGVGAPTTVAGGDFLNVGGALQTRIALFNNYSSTPDYSLWDHNPNGSVRVIIPVSPGDSLVYFVGGAFTTIGGVTRNGLAVISQGEAVGTMNISAGSGSSTVYSLATSGTDIYNDTTTLYVGGNFTTLGGSTRNRIGSITYTKSTKAGSLNTWNPNASSDVNAIMVSRYRDTVYVGGAFTTIGTTPATRNRIAGLDSSGRATNWDPNANNVVRAIINQDMKDREVFVGGDFTSISSKYQTGFASFNSATIQFQSAESTLDESTTPANIVISLDQADTASISINFDDVQSGGAVVGTDYTMPSIASVSIAPGSTTANIPLTIIDNSVRQNDRQIIVQLSNAVGGNLGPLVNHVHTITDTDSTPQVQFRKTYTGGREGAVSTFYPTLELTGPIASDVSVTLTPSGTATGGGVDYTFPAGPYVIPAGQMELTIPVTVIDDGSTEANETAIITISAPVNATLGTNTAYTHTITDGVRIKSGSYVGDGLDNRTVTGVGFQPDMVMIRANAATNTVFRTSTMDTNKTYYLNKTPQEGALTGLIKTFDSDGFTVGTDAKVNGSGTTYYWTAFYEAPGEFEVGTFTGDGTDERVVDIGFQPDFVMLVTENVLPQYIMSHMIYPDSTFNFGNSVQFPSRYRGIIPSGFVVNGILNEASVTHHYMAFKKVDGLMNTGTYTGNAVDDRSISGVGFQPDLVMVHLNLESGGKVIIKSSATGSSTDTSFDAANAALTTNQIQKLDTPANDGFQVGTSNSVNKSNGTFSWAAFKANP